MERGRCVQSCNYMIGSHPKATLTSKVGVASCSQLPALLTCKRRTARDVRLPAPTPIWSTRLSNACA